MHRISPAVQRYAWGSPTAIPEFAGWESDDRPVAEAWYGAHPGGDTTVHGGGTLRDLVATDPVGVMGQDVVDRFGHELPYLLKIIAPDEPLSLQVHPSAQQAALGWVTEQRAGVPLDAWDRTYKDANHKPEMVYALTTFTALSGFRARRRALEILHGLDGHIMRGATDRLRHGSSAQGVRSAFEYILLGARDRDEEVPDVVDQVRRRLEDGSTPSEQTDALVLDVARAHPGDRGILAALLLNPVTLNPGEAMFVPAGAVHAYLSGLGVEIMAASDNVIRAGMTRKHVDARALVDVVDVNPAPPIRVAPEHVASGTRVYYAPVEDFELAVIDLGARPVEIRGYGPRIVLCVEGSATVVTERESESLRTGEAVFVPDGHHAQVRGAGRVVRASVP
ncbi:mannose-6-phosphate isomerase, class I [Serinibacter salmoneus]|uniref:mannose-6-phosphate isomerase n=1 Tax=Serinibacter salmoneus TaxID=556530 RepID=A0A2A9D3F1_9MICO|nr:mannose-6-phosphate isomerase, class I [Serinibacter salmoneus]PFG20370.1 mannose-6-phosphate isomerase type 1 [Serinibacter salmoneus]